MPGTPSSEPALGNFFSFEIDGQKLGVYHSLSGLKWSCDVVEMKGNNSQNKLVDRAIPGRYNNTAELVLKTYSLDKSMLAWFEKTVEQGPAGMKNGAIAFLGPDGKPLAKYKFTKGWPSKLNWSGLAAGNSAAMEIEITIQVETISLAA